MTSSNWAIRFVSKESATSILVHFVAGHDSPWKASMERSTCALMGLMTQTDCFYQSHSGWTRGRLSRGCCLLSFVYFKTHDPSPLSCWWTNGGDHVMETVQSLPHVKDQTIHLVEKKHELPINCSYLVSEKNWQKVVSLTERLKHGINCETWKTQSVKFENESLCSIVSIKAAVIRQTAPMRD